MDAIATETGWAVFRFTDGEMRRISMVGGKNFATGMLEFDDCTLSYLKADGVDPTNLYIRPVGLWPGTP